MSSTLMLDHDQARLALPFEPLLAAVRRALVETAAGRASAPPRIAAFGPHGLLGAMPGYVPGLGLGGKLTSVFGIAGAEGRSAHAGVVTLFDEADGRLLAIINGEAVTAIRTAASATVAFLALRPPHVRRIAVIGAGTQARAQLELLAHLGLGAEIIVASRTADHAQVLADEVGVRAGDSIRHAVTEAEAVFVCTDADRPVIRHAWLQPLVHVSSVGGSRGPEIDAVTMRAGRVFAEWPGAVSCAPPAGAHELQGFDPDAVRLVGDTLDTPSDVNRGTGLTVFKSTGFAALDVAAAAVAHATALERGLGTHVAL